MAIDPRGADLKRFLQDGEPGEVVMVNLLRFVEGGREHYEEYARAIGPFLAKVGATITYAGIAGEALVAEDGQAWDAIVIARYPSRKAFSSMVADPGYQAVTHLRTKALRETVLQPTTPWRV